jgi:hypothetical protein
MQNHEIQEKTRQTNLERYGVECPSQSLDVQAKIKQTNVERYGAESPQQNKNVQHKTLQTIRERYGVENLSQNSEIRGKIKQVVLDRYGVANIFCDKSIQAKIKQTNLERYGAENPMQNHEIQEKTRQTNLERYGVECPSQSLDVQAKIKQTNVERYGFACTMQNPEVQQKAWNTKLKKGYDCYHSKPEYAILEWVRQYYPEARAAAANGRQIDVLIPSLNLAIEYNGLWWHCDSCQAPKTKKYHIEKQRALKEKGIRTIFIWENEWEGRQEQAKNLLLAAMKIPTVRLGARKCEFREIGHKQALVFIHENHIQPIKKKQKISLGCFHEGTLVAVATFGLHHRNSKEIALTRFCCLPGYHIAGALSKFSKMAFAHFGKPLVSWADLMKSEGTGYVAAGWKVDKILKPDYFYIDTKHSCKIVSKQSRRKSSAKTPEGMTEAEHAKLDGLARCWDCGKIKFVFNG